MTIEPLTVGFIGFGILFLLLFLGMPIGFTFAIIGFSGAAYFLGWTNALQYLTSTPFTVFNLSYTMTVVPLFIFMGALCYYAGVSSELYFTVYNWIGRLPGGLAMATVGACAMFAAVSGSSLATAATMGTVALPEMRKYKYDDALATGAVAAGGTIGILIPPSIALVIYGLFAEQSIGRLFAAGLIPGILEAVFYMITIFTLSKINPHYGPPGPRTTWRTKIYSLKATWSVVVLFGMVMGGLYFGFFTPTEAGAVGAFGAFVIALGRRRLTWHGLASSLADSGKTVGFIFLILLGAIIFFYFMVQSQVPERLSAFIVGLQVNRYIIIAGLMVMYIFLGCVMEGLAIILLTTSVILPLVVSMGFDPIWFGIILVRVLEMGLITPPVGINVFVIKGVAKDVPMYTIFKGIIPFLIADIFHVTLLIAVPKVVMWLPDMMRQMQTR